MDIRLDGTHHSDHRSTQGIGLAIADWRPRAAPRRDDHRPRTPRRRARRRRDRGAGRHDRISSPPTSPTRRARRNSSPRPREASAASTRWSMPRRSPTALRCSTARSALWDRLFSVNARAPFFLMQPPSAHARGARRPARSSTSSRCTPTAARRRSPSTASKAALAGADQERRPRPRFDRIRVNGIIARLGRHAGRAPDAGRHARAWRGMARRGRGASSRSGGCSLPRTWRRWRYFC